jgi:hypothetical protein
MNSAPVTPGTKVPLHGKSDISLQDLVIGMSHGTAQMLKIPAELGRHGRERIAERVGVNPETSALLEGSIMASIP